MNKDIFEGKWEETIEGNHQEIFGILQKHYGHSKDQAESAVKDFKNKH